MRVDGTSPHVAEVLPLGYVLWCYLARYLLCSLFHLLRIAVGQSVLGEYSMHLGGVVASLTKDVYHLTYDALRVFRGPRYHPDQSLVARLSSLQFL